MNLASIAELEGVEVPFLHINHLIQNKKIINRPKDQIDVIELEKIRQMRELNETNNKRSMPSSVVARIHYYAETSTLRVVYVSGAIYDYLDVPQEVYEEMKGAFSKGTFLNTRIKDTYDFRKVSD